MDVAGNMAFCTTSVLVQDNMNNCSPPSVIAGNIMTEQAQGVSEVSVKLSGTAGTIAVDKTTLTNALGKYSFNVPLAQPLQMVLSPMKE